MHTSSPLLTQPTGLRAKLMAALESSQTGPSKVIKWKLDNDDQVLVIFQNLIAGGADKDEDNNCNKDNKDSSVYTHWINYWIDKPVSEQRRTHRDGRPGWGKPKIMSTASITEAQYTHYMVDLPSILAVELTDSISPSDLRIVCVITISTSQRPSTTTVRPTWMSIFSLFKRLVQSMDIS